MTPAVAGSPVWLQPANLPLAAASRVTQAPSPDILSSQTRLLAGAPTSSTGSFRATKLSMQGLERSSKRYVVSKASSDRDEKRESSPGTPEPCQYPSLAAWDSMEKMQSGECTEDDSERDAPLQYKRSHRRTEYFETTAQKIEQLEAAVSQLKENFASVQQEFLQHSDDMRKYGENLRSALKEYLVSNERRPH